MEYTGAKNLAKEFDQINHFKQEFPTV